MSIENIAAALTEAFELADVPNNAQSDAQDALDVLVDTYTEQLQKYQEMLIVASAYIEKLEANVRKADSEVLRGDEAFDFWTAIAAEFEV